MIKINPRSSKPIYKQIVDGIKENILKGILKPKDKLPSVRKMSSLLLVNPNTVSKAYAELERDKVIEIMKGRGTYISSNYKVKMEEEKIIELKQNLKEAVIEAHYIGVDKKNLINIIDEIYDELERK